MDYLVVGGGGGGGGDNGGGGGGGGVYAGSTTIGTLTYAVEVGSGGKGTWTSSNSFNATDGIPSSFVDPSGPTTRTAGGGGGSGGYCMPMEEMDYHQVDLVVVEHIQLMVLLETVILRQFCGDGGSGML